MTYLLLGDWIDDQEADLNYTMYVGPRSMSEEEVEEHISEHAQSIAPYLEALHGLAKIVDMDEVARLRALVANERSRP